MILSEAETSPRITIKFGGKGDENHLITFGIRNTQLWRESLHVSLNSLDLSGTSREIQPSREKRKWGRGMRMEEKRARR